MAIATSGSEFAEMAKQLIMIEEDFSILWRIP
jgi:hypothetical protein